MILLSSINTSSASKPTPSNNNIFKSKISTPLSQSIEDQTPIQVPTVTPTPTQTMENQPPIQVPTVTPTPTQTMENQPPIQAPDVIRSILSQKEETKETKKERSDINHDPKECEKEKREYLLAKTTLKYSKSFKNVKAYEDAMNNLKNCLDKYKLNLSDFPLLTTFWRMSSLI